MGFHWVLRDGTTLPNIQRFLQHTADLVMFEKVAPAPDHSFRSPYRIVHSTRRLLTLTVYSYRSCDALGCVAALSFFQP